MAGAVACALAAVGAAQASAGGVTRYAAPGGNAPAANCQSSSMLAQRCSIATAAAGAGVFSDDTVVVEPGSYSDTNLANGGDLGAGGSFTQVAGDIHGQAGKPRPLITLTALGSNPAVTVTGKLSHLELVNPNVNGPLSNFAITTASGVVDDVISRTARSSATACEVDAGLLRNSFCVATSGTGGTGVGSGTIGPSTDFTPKLRGVTAVASGASVSARGIKFLGSTGDITVYAKSVIARAPGGTDVEVNALDTGTASLQIDHANYSTFLEASGGEIADQGSQQTTPPVFAADGYHQLPTSVSTIDQGQTDSSSGDYDLDGQARSINRDAVIGENDIGADELGRSTSTYLECVPASLALSTGPTTCNASVTDISPGLTGGPGGIVSFVSDSSGTLSGGGKCTLIPVGIGFAQGECQLSYTPNTLGTGTHQINGTYGGGFLHEGSAGQIDVGVTPAPPDSDGDGIPDPSDNCPTVAGSGSDGCPPALPAAAVPVPTPSAAGLTTAAVATKCKKGRKLKKGKCVKRRKR